MSALPRLQPGDFAGFFKALHGVDPFPWQTRLLNGLVSGNGEAQQSDANEGESNPQQWPAAMALPTASGKTACIDIALFHLALQADSPPDQRTAPRRIFFCVDRRVIVDEAFDRARRIAAKLACALGQRTCAGCRNGAGGSKCAQTGALRSVASRLRLLAGGDTAAPLAVFQLRGGMFRDDAWATSPLQPTVICTTVDQLGSRLLFRGYGVSPLSASIHAGLTANDVLILLDEAHCAEPFRQTLDAVRLFRGEKWCEPGHAIKTPFAFVEMSATPRSGSKAFELDDDDRNDAELSTRLKANKPAILHASKQTTATAKFAEELATQAKEWIQAGSKRIAVMVNRVDTARMVHDELRQSRGCDTILMIGRMRPLDRDDLVSKWQPKLKATPGTEEREAHDKPIVVVATQCLEVGANLDFDALITEAASLDALRQRFGRLNRLGRDEQCRAVIVAPKDAVSDNADDPIYGPAIAKTWAWLQKHAQAKAADDAQAAAAGHAHAAASTTRKKKNAATGAAMDTIDFGIAVMDKIIADDQPGRECFAPAPDAPVLLPAHLDLWCQTAPIPDPDPDVSIFLHGPQRGAPTVSVCWRADLGDDPEQWAEIVSLLPPSSPECMPVPLHLLRKWMQDKLPLATQDTGDVEEAAAPVDDDEDRHERNGESRYVLRWRGMPRDNDSETRATNDPNDLRPGDVIVIPAALAPTCTFGHLPGVTAGQSLSAEACARLDHAEQANLIARRRGVLRLRVDRLQSSPSAPSGGDDAPTANDWTAVLRDVLATWNPVEPPDDFYPSLKDALAQAPKPSPGAELLDSAAARTRIAHELSQLSASRLQRAATPHPAGGLVLSLPGHITLDSPEEAEDDSSTDESDRSNIDCGASIRLERHTRSVVERATRFASCLPGNGFMPAALINAARLHDLGKLDPRWQGMIRSGQPPARVAHLPPLAKSDAPLRTATEQRAAARRAGLPPGFRHEMLSMQIAEHARCKDGRSLLDGLPDDLRDLVLHLIASHHGHARPLAPVVSDDSPQPLPGFDLETNGKGDGRLVLPAMDASGRTDWEKIPAHRLDSGVCDRFWTLTRRYGWWGLAYLEAILRLADRAVSREEQENAVQRPGVVRASGPRALVTGGPAR